MNTKRWSALLLILIALCLTAAGAGETSATSAVRGVVKMAMINAIVLTGEDEQVYRFAITRQTSHPDAAHIGAGRSVSVVYTGTYKDGCEAEAIALLGKPMGSSADDAPMAAPINPDAPLQTLSGRIATLGDGVLSVTVAEQGTLDFIISGAVLLGDANAAEGDSAQVTFYDDENGNRTATNVLYTRDGASFGAADADPGALIGVDDQTADAVLVDDLAPGWTAPDDEAEDEETLDDQATDGEREQTEAEEQ